MAKPTVHIWAEDIVLPTYLAGEPNRNPMFLEKRVYQGSSGRVYPYPVIDKISEGAVAERHRAVFLENEYLKLMVMPGFGGRIQYAYDKTNSYPFIYHNRVIKPALVGLAGPWLSGGIEFNWPQHHRPGTYCPVDYAIRANPDGSQTLWLSEIEPMWHLKGTLGLTLYPARALLEINIRLFNPTPLPQSFHLWTNPAVHVNDRYQSVFPPDVQAVYDHGKRDVSTFPIARGHYYKVDYRRGVDISWYKNLPVPTSYMAAQSSYDFLGGYDHGRQAGVLHVADHHFVPGKKQWVWGCGEFGKAWDRNLTDGDGPYAELMCGVFADNQPDFSWLQPLEEKEVQQFFLPYKAIGYVRNATIHATASLELSGGQAQLGVYTTARRDGAVVRLTCQGKTVWNKELDLSPEKPLLAQAPVPRQTAPQQFRLEARSAAGELLVAYTPEPKQAEAIPEPAKAIPEPVKAGTTEELYLSGLHLEQYRHATREPEAYYREALRRDPDDSRNNNALGLLWLRRGQFARAETFFRRAIQTLSRHNPNPRDGEPYYNLGVCLRYLGRGEEATEVFCKAAWNAAWQDAAFFQLAQLASQLGDQGKALEWIERSLARNAVNQKATHLHIVLLRKIGRTDEARRRVDAARQRDPLDFGACLEWLELHSERPQKAPKQVAAVLASLHRNAHTCLEIAADYAGAGFYSEAIGLLKSGATAASPRAGGFGATPTSRTERAPGHLGRAGMPNARPMLFYFQGYYAWLQGDERSARRYFQQAARQSPECCFPNGLDCIVALQTALRFNPRDGRAGFYLGNLWYDKRQVAEATACWERAAHLQPRLPTIHRNLALAYFNKQHAPVKARRALEQAFASDPSDARVLFELDLLKKRMQVPPERRLAFLQRHRPLVEQREDLLLELVTLFNFFGRHDEALQILLNRQFHPWEGGEGKVTGQYVVSLVESAKQLLSLNDAAVPMAKEAIALLERARVYPANLGEGKLSGAQENSVLYWLGVAWERLDDLARATSCWQEAALGMKHPTLALYYNDQNPETIFYQGLALSQLGRPAAARERFQTLLTFSQQHRRDRTALDYFAVSLPEFMVFDEDLAQRNQINCRYLSALGTFGLGRRTPALSELGEVLRLDPSHQPAKLHVRQFTKGRRPSV